MTLYLSEFAAAMVQHADVLVRDADDSDVEGCFQVLFKDIQVRVNARLKLQGSVQARVGTSECAFPLHERDTCEVCFSRSFLQFRKR